MKAFGHYELSRFDQKKRFPARSLFSVFLLVLVLLGTLVHPSCCAGSVWVSQENGITAFLGLPGPPLRVFKSSKLAFLNHFLMFLSTEGAFNRLIIDSESHPRLSGEKYK